MISDHSQLPIMRPMRSRMPSLLARGLMMALCASTWSLTLAETAPDARRASLAGDVATLKAAFLYNFALYTSWPLPTPGVFTLCSIGHDELGAAFDALTHKQVDGKPVQVRRIDSVTDARNCHLLYVPESSGASLPALARGLASQPVLIVSDARNLDGAMILIEPDGNRLVFSVNLARVRQSGLDVSSKLLRLARAVK